jgi:hypothetical protein
MFFILSNLQVTTNAEVWQSYSTLLYRIVTLDEKEKANAGEDVSEKWHKLIQFQQKAIRCRIQEKNWEKVPENTEKVVESTFLLCSSE